MVHDRYLELYQLLLSVPLGAAQRQISSAAFTCLRIVRQLIFEAPPEPARAPPPPPGMVARPGDDAGEPGGKGFETYTKRQIERTASHNRRRERIE